jgi:hypothetical protein
VTCKGPLKINKPSEKWLLDIFKQEPTEETEKGNTTHKSIPAASGPLSLRTSITAQTHVMGQSRCLGKQRMHGSSFTKGENKVDGENRGVVEKQLRDY